eukprot:2710408-Prymnesium_polylepis.1
MLTGRLCTLVPDFTIRLCESSSQPVRMLALYSSTDCSRERDLVGSPPLKIKMCCVSIRGYGAQPRVTPLLVHRKGCRPMEPPALRLRVLVL